MTTKYAEINYLKLQLRMASKRLGMINFSLTRDGDDPRLRAEADALECQIRAMEAELKMLTSEAA